MLAHLGHDTQAVHFGQHAIDHGDIVRSRQRQCQARFAVAGFVDDVSGFLEPVHKIALRLDIVFYDQNAHVCLRSKTLN